jgi:hypothetical protein
VKYRLERIGDELVDYTLLLFRKDPVNGKITLKWVRWVGAGWVSDTWRVPSEKPGDVLWTGGVNE